MLTIGEISNVPSGIPFAISSSAGLAGLEDQRMADENEIAAEGQSTDNPTAKAARIAEYEAALEEIQLKIAQLQQLLAQDAGGAASGAGEPETLGRIHGNPAQGTSLNLVA